MKKKRTGTYFAHLREIQAALGVMRREGPVRDLEEALLVLSEEERKRLIPHVIGAIRAIKLGKFKET